MFISSLYLQKKTLKKTFCILLFLALALRPIYHVSYIVYYGCNINSIIEKYCINKDEPELQCNGKCHLAKKIAPENTNSTDNVTLNSITEAFFPVFKDNQFKFSCKEIFKKRKVKNNWKLSKLHQVQLVFKDEQPPDFLV